MTKRASLFSDPSAPSKPAAAEPPATPPPAAADARRHAVAKSRQGKRNATAYLEPEALQQLKMIAVREDTTVQALLVEGINEVFAKRGLSRIA